MYSINYDYLPLVNKEDKRVRKERGTACFSNLKCENKEFDLDDMESKNGIVLFYCPKRPINKDDLGVQFSTMDVVNWLYLGYLLGYRMKLVLAGSSGVFRSKKYRPVLMNINEFTKLANGVELPVAKYNQNHCIVVENSKSVSNDMRLANLTFARYLFEENRPSIVQYYTQNLERLAQYTALERFKIINLCGWRTVHGRYGLKDPNYGHSIGSAADIVRMDSTTLRERLRLLKNHKITGVTRVWQGGNDDNTAWIPATIGDCMDDFVHILAKIFEMSMEEEYGDHAWNITGYKKVPFRELMMKMRVVCSTINDVTK